MDQAATRHAGLDAMSSCDGQAVLVHDPGTGFQVHEGHGHKGTPQHRELRQARHRPRRHRESQHGVGRPRCRRLGSEKASAFAYVFGDNFSERYLRGRMAVAEHPDVRRGSQSARDPRGTTEILESGNRRQAFDYPTMPVASARSCPVTSTASTGAGHGRDDRRHGRVGRREGDAVLDESRSGELDQVRPCRWSITRPHTPAT